MKRSTRFLSVLLCFALLSIGFSTIASAETVEVKPYQILQNNYINVNTGQHADFGTLYLFQPNNDFEEKHEERKRWTSNPNMTLYVSRYGWHHTYFSIKNVDESPILLGDKSYKVRLSNIYHSMLFEYNGYQYYIRAPRVDSIFVHYTDGTQEEITSYSINSKKGEPYCDVSFDVTTAKDVLVIIVGLKSYFNDCVPSDIWSLSNGNPYFTSYYGEYNGDDKYQFSLEVESQESGLLKSVIEWLKGIKTKADDIWNDVKMLPTYFSELTNNLVSWFGTLIENIIELPSKIWEFISEGLKSLFVPTTEQMAEYSDKWDTLLSNRFGALYEVDDVISNVTNSITNIPSAAADEGIITIPTVSLEEFGIPFTFGGYEVDIRPQGFDFLITICKRIISIVCTLAFVNAIRKRYETVVG